MWPLFKVLRDLMVKVTTLQKFCGHRSFCGSDAAVKIVHMTFQDQMIKGSGKFMEGNSSLYVPTLPKLIAMDIVLMDM